jgi:hypothetical protein
MNKPGVRGNPGAIRRIVGDNHDAAHFPIDGELQFLAEVGTASFAATPLWGLDRTLDLECGLRQLTKRAEPREEQARASSVLERMLGQASGGPLLSLPCLVRDAPPALERTHQAQPISVAFTRLAHAEMEAIALIRTLPRSYDVLHGCASELDSRLCVVTDPDALVGSPFSLSRIGIPLCCRRSSFGTASNTIGRFPRGVPNQGARRHFSCGRCVPDRKTCETASGNIRRELLGPTIPPCDEKN